MFDMDGTLIDLEKKPKYRGLENKHKPFLSLKAQMKKIAAENGVPVEVVDGLDRMALIWNAVRRYAEDNGLAVKELMEGINEPFMEHERNDHNISFLMLGTVPGLTSLKELGYEMNLVTTASRWSYDLISTSDEYRCFGSFFKHSITRDDVMYIKPDPQPLLKMMGLCGRAEAVYVGDSDHDGYAASAAGCKFVLINTREYDKETITSFSPDGVIDTLTQLPGLLTKLNL